MALRSFFLWAIGGLTVLFFGISLLLFAANFFDDKLDPEIEAILKEAPPEQIPAKDNGYFAWIGVMGPEDQKPHDWGRRLFRETLLIDKGSLTTHKAAKPSMLKEMRQESAKQESFPCYRLDSCLQTIANKPQVAEEALQKGKTTLARGDEATRFPAFQEVWRPDEAYGTFLPDPSLEWKELTAARFALKITQGLHDEALADLEREMAFHTRQVQGGNSMGNQVLGIINLLARYQMLNQYMRQHPKAAKQRADKLTTLLAPLPSGALSLKPAISNEIRSGARALLNFKPKTIEYLPAKVSEILYRQYYLPNATINDLFKTHLIWLAAESTAGPDYRKKQAEAAASLKNSIGEMRYSPRNPVGRIIGKMQLPRHSEIISARDGLLALRALVALQLELLKSGSEQPEAIAKAVETAALVNPYTGKKAKWNAQKRTIGFDEAPDTNELVIHIGNQE